MQSTCNHLLQLRLNVRETRRGNQEWTIQRQWQHWEHKTQDVNYTMMADNFINKTKHEEILSHENI
jgi:hypothetical protein